MPRLAPAPFIVAGLALAALTVRLPHLQQPLLGFHPTRQYRSAMIARACYYERATVPDWARATARANRAMQPAGEPPIMEWLACGVYQALGSERLEVARVLASIAWLLGVVPLYEVMMLAASPPAAVVGVATYLFTPFGIVASRAFMPDALMTSCALYAIWGFAAFHRRQTPSRLTVAVVSMAIATVVKPMSVFLTIPAAAACAISLGSGVRALRSLRAWLAPGLGLVPGVAYYGYGALFGTLARDQMQLRFVPSLLDTQFFWGGLWTQGERVFGVPLLVSMAVGTLVAPRGLARALLVGLWIGYGAFAAAFTYHMPTHNYYHLPYLTLAALAVAAIFERAFPTRWHGHIWTAAVAVAALIVVTGASAAWPAITNSDQKRVEEYEVIGELVDHSTHVLFLDLNYGYPLMYHGQVTGDAWPTSDDLAAERLAGATPVSAQERYARDFADYEPTHFIVTDLASLAAQSDLQQLLAQLATVVKQTRTYQVYQFTAARR